MKDKFGEIQKGVLGRRSGAERRVRGDEERKRKFSHTLNISLDPMVFFLLNMVRVRKVAVMEFLLARECYWRTLSSLLRGLV